MKYGTATETKTLTGGGVGAPQQFSIQNSQIAFETLSSRLYSDPIRAVIRELCCNAWDAHVMTGKKDFPFEVHLPTKFDPSFRVKDWGPGMDHEQVMSLYCTYFASDKTRRNDAIGAFGLGSKSPFAYFLRNGKTGGFSVISRQGGVARTYTALIEEGFPKVRLDCEAKTEEGDGLEVIFPVEQKDVWEFENKAKVVFEFFIPLPNVNEQLNVERPMYSIETERWGLRKESLTAQGSGVRAVMGGVAYAVGNIDVSRMTDDQKRVFEMPLDLFFEIGEVNPAISRESLQLDGNTIAAVTKALDEVNAEVLEQVKSKIDAAANGWEGRLVVWNLLKHEAIGKIVNEAYERGFLACQYRNFSLEKGKDISINELDYSSIQVYRFGHNWNRRKNPERSTLLRLDPEAKKEVLKNVKVGTADRKQFERGFEISPSVQFVVDDMRGRTADRFVSYYVQQAEDNPDKKVVYLLSGIKDAKPEKVMEESTRLLARLGDPPIITASSLKEKYIQHFPKVQATPRHRGVLKFKEDRYYSSRRKGWSVSWKRMDENTTFPAGPKYYVLLEGKTRDGGMAFGLSTAKAMSDFIGHLRDSMMFGMDSTANIYGLRKKSKLCEDSEWVELSAHVKETIKREMNPARELALSLQVRPFSSDWEPFLAYILKHDSLGNGSPLQAFAKALDEGKKACGETGEHITAVLNVMKYDVATTTDFTEEWERVSKLYPMLGICRRSRYGSSDTKESAILVNYAKMVERGMQKPLAAIPAVPAKPQQTPEERLAAYRVRKAKEQREYYKRKKDREAAERLVVTIEPTNADGKGISGSFPPPVMSDSGAAV